jgi:pimeloyl-ACP methyl ester carboxylesterase
MKHILVTLLFLPLILQAQFKTEEVDVSELISGTLYLPETKQQHSLVILHAGSGPTDRNGNQPGMENNSLKMLCEALAQNGIAAFTYDKRMFKLALKEDFDERELTFDHQIDDAELVIHHFRKDERFSKIIPAGHSEGSLVCMVAAERASADAFISIAGPGNSIDVVITEQIVRQLPMLEDELKSTFAALKKGDTVTVTNPYIAGMFHAGVQPFLMSWMKYAPHEEIKKLNIPVLIINGTNDMQVARKEAELLKASKPDAQLIHIENMNHVLKETKVDMTENLAAYNNPDLPIHADLVKAMVEFVGGLK